jgi:pimeloyl-ACP methyl ester carboxylesterase
MNELFSVRQGTGKIKVVLVHGNTASLNWWKPLMKAFQDDFDFLALDLKGYGESPACAPNVTIDQHAADIYELVKEKDFGQFILVGHSLGGTVAMRFAANYPEMLSGLMLVSTTRSYPPIPKMMIQFNKLLLRIKAFRVMALKKLMLQKELEPAFFEELVEDVRKSLPSVVYNTLAFDGQDFARDGVKFTKPVLVVHGKKDPLLPLAEADKSVAAYPTSKLELMEGMGHCPIVEDVEAFGNILKKFAAEVAGE